MTPNTKCSDKHKRRGSFPNRCNHRHLVATDQPVVFETCHVCAGSGRYREPIYHNDYSVVDCSYCGQTGQVRVRAGRHSSECNRCLKTSCSSCPVAIAVAARANSRFPECVS